MMVCAPTNSGKTHFVRRLLEKSDVMFTIPPSAVLYCYSVWQPIFEEMQQSVSNITFLQGLPAKEDIEELSKGALHTVCVFDDLMDVTSESGFVQQLFYAGNHFNLTIINIVQNIFQKGKVSRTCSLNTHYFVLFKNSRDVQQIHTLGRQIFWRNVKYFMDVFQRCTHEKFAYLLVDLNPHSDKKYQLRTAIFPGEDTRVFVPKE